METGERATRLPDLRSQPAGRGDEPVDIGTDRHLDRASRRRRTGHATEQARDHDATSSVGVTISAARWSRSRSEEHTSELQSRGHLVCRLLLEKKKNNFKIVVHSENGNV